MAKQKAKKGEPINRGPAPFVAQLLRQALEGRAFVTAGNVRFADDGSIDEASIWIRVRPRGRQPWPG